MSIFRYYITNDKKQGTLIAGNINGKKMLTILKDFIKAKPDINVNETVKAITETYNFSIIKQNLSFIDLNENQDTPYTFYHIIDDGGYVEEDGYIYTNIQEIKSEVKQHGK